MALSKEIGGLWRVEGLASAQACLAAIASAQNQAEVKAVLWVLDSESYEDLADLALIRAIETHEKPLITLIKGEAKGLKLAYWLLGRLRLVDAGLEALVFNYLEAFPPFGSGQRLLRLLGLASCLDLLFGAKRGYCPVSLALKLGLAQGQGQDLAALVQKIPASDREGKGFKLPKGPMQSPENQFALMLAIAQIHQYPQEQQSLALALISALHQGGSLQSLDPAIQIETAHALSLAKNENPS